MQILVRVLFFGQVLPNFEIVNLQFEGKERILERR